MSESMIERVARAIFSRVPVGYGMTKHEAKEYARAAIEAMREPTTEMGFAGYDQLDREVSPHAAASCWTAMIDKALEEGK